jgi:hypothetical protein
MGIGGSVENASRQVPSAMRCSKGVAWRASIGGPSRLGGSCGTSVLTIDCPSVMQCNRQVRRDVSALALPVLWQLGAALVCTEVSFFCVGANKNPAFSASEICVPSANSTRILAKNRNLRSDQRIELIEQTIFLLQLGDDCLYVVIFARVDVDFHQAFKVCKRGAKAK